MPEAMFDRAAGYYLHDIVFIVYPCGGIVYFVVQQILADNIPVDQESGLESVHSFPDYPEMGVAPDAPFRALLIPVGNIHSSHIADLSVDNNDLPVITVIDFAGEDRESYFQEGMYFYTCILHLVKETVLYVPATYVIV